MLQPAGKRILPIPAGFFLWYPYCLCRRPEMEDTMAKFFSYAERISLQKFLAEGLSLQKKKAERS